MDERAHKVLDQSAKESDALHEAFTTRGSHKPPQVSVLAQAYCLQHMVEAAHWVFERADIHSAKEAFSDEALLGLFLTLHMRLNGARSELADKVAQLEEAASAAVPDA